MAKIKDWAAGMAMCVLGLGKLDGWWLIAEGLARAIPRGVAGAEVLMDKAAIELGLERKSVERLRSLWFFYGGPVKDAEENDRFRFSTYRDVMPQFPENPSAARRFLQGLPENAPSGGRWTREAVLQELLVAGVITDPGPDSAGDNVSPESPADRLKNLTRSTVKLGKRLASPEYGFDAESLAAIDRSIKILNLRIDNQAIKLQFADVSLEGDAAAGNAHDLDTELRRQVMEQVNQITTTSTGSNGDAEEATSGADRA